MEYLTVRDLAKRYGVGEETIRRWHRSGYLPDPRPTPGAALHWSHRDLREWEKAGGCEVADTAKLEEDDWKRTILEAHADADWSDTVEVPSGKQIIICMVKPIGELPANTVCIVSEEVARKLIDNGSAAKVAPTD